MDTPRGPVQVGLALTAAMILVAVVALVSVTRAPTAETPERLIVPNVSTEPVGFSIAGLDRISRKHVDEYGLVDYEGLAKDHGRLDAFLEQVAATSPDTNVATFSSAEEGLAYWINAYNAWMMKAVIEAYPTDSVKDISSDPDVFDSTGRICGGEDLSLNQIENEIVRTRFLEPRAHFALNCASMGCPRLPQEAFDAKRLDEQLDREARRFFADPTHLAIDVEAKTVALSSILNWYQEDFLRWLREEKGLEDPSILDFARLYVPEEVADSIGDDFTVEYQEYDWRLNDQQAEWAESRRSADAAVVAER